jgi:hypothetical protein
MRMIKTHFPPNNDKQKAIVTTDLQQLKTI